MQDEHGWGPLGPCTAVMERTLVRFDVTGKMDLPKQVSDVLCRQIFALPGRKRYWIPAALEDSRARAHDSSTYTRVVQAVVST